MEFISNLSNPNHRDTLTRLIDWADECYFCTSFFDKKGLDIVLPNFKKGILERDLKVQIFSNGEKEYTKPFVIKSLKKTVGIDHRVIVQKGLRLHSKIYLFEKQNKFVLIVGSANITGNGLVKNEEFSTRIDGNTNSKEYKDIKNYFEHLSTLKSD